MNESVKGRGNERQPRGKEDLRPNAARIVRRVTLRTVTVCERGREPGTAGGVIF